MAFFAEPLLNPVPFLLALAIFGADWRMAGAAMAGILAKLTADALLARRLRGKVPSLTLLVLGTPLKDGRDTLGGHYRDLSGARRLPAFPDPERSPTCVSLYGD
jgi:hypothetical protein